MAEKNSLWKNIRNKAKQNKESGATPKKPTAEMLRQERKIKAQKADGGPVNTLEGDLISKVIMNRNRSKDFVQRAYAVGEYPESNMFVQPDANEFGQKNSHLMGWGEDKSGQAYMYPEVMNPNNEAIKVPNQYADYISSTGYKKATGIPYADGGYMYPEGGKVKLKSYTDLKEFKKAEQAYNDSLGVYNATQFLNKNVPTSTNALMAGDTYEDPIVRRAYSITDRTGIRPIETGRRIPQSYSANPSSPDYYNELYIKKPTPVKYNPPPLLPPIERLNSLKATIVNNIPEETIKGSIEYSPVVMPEGLPYYNAQQNSLYPPDWMVKKKGTPGWDRYNDNQFKELQKNEELSEYKDTFAIGGKIEEGKIPNFKNGTYANNQGVIMGPVKTPEGYLVPKNLKGEPVVNLPEFTVKGYEGIDGETKKLLKYWANYNALYDEDFDDPTIKNRYNKIKSLYKASGNPKLDITVPAPKYAAQRKYNFLYSDDENNPKRDSLINVFTEDFNKNQGYKNKSIDPKNLSTIDKISMIPKKIFSTANYYSPFTNEINYTGSRLDEEGFNDPLIAELTHAYQQNKLKKNVANSWVKEMVNKPSFSKGDYNDKYNDKTSFEYEAHSEIEPLMRDFINNKVTLEEIYNLTNKQKKAKGGKMYPEGGTYANNQGVVMGPVQLPDGRFSLPATQDNTPVVNMAPFEVISTGDFSKPNPYSPTDGRSFYEGIVDMFIPNVEREQQPIDPKTGFSFPASGRADYDYSTEMALAAPIAQGVKYIGKGVSKAYNTIATGNSPLPIAWKSPAVGLSPETSDDMFKTLVNSGKLSDAERAVVIDYQYNSRPFTGRSGKVNVEKRNQINDIIKKYSINADNTAIATRKFNPTNNSIGATIENSTLNFGDRPTSFSAGVGKSDYTSGSVDRIVIPNRSLKKLNKKFTVNDYGPISEDAIKHLEIDPQFINHNYNNPAATILKSERELIGTGLNLKQVGKVKNDIGGYDWIVQHKTKAEGGFYPTQGPPKALFKGYAQGGYTNPYNQYQDDPYLQYKVGGKVWQGIGNAAYNVLSGTLGTITGGLTDPLMDMGEDALQKAANPNFDPNNPEDVKAMRQINTAGAAGQIGGSILGLTVNPANVGSAVAGAGKGANEIVQSSTASDSAKQWSQGLSGIAQFGNMMNGAGATTAAGAGAGATEGASASTSNFKNIMTNFSGTKFGKSAGKAMPFVNQAAGMLGSNDGSLLQQGIARQDYLNSPEYIAQQALNNQQYVNQGLSFSHGGNITNNSLNLQTMTNRYKDYKNKMSKGGIPEDFGVSFIPKEAGIHNESSYGGVPIGQQSLAEGGEAIMYDEQGQPSYVMPYESNGEKNMMDFTIDKNGKIKNSKYTLAAAMQKKLSRLRGDSTSEHSANQIKKEFIDKREMLSQINAIEDAKKTVMEEYVAAYGGKLPNKYKGKINMPNSLAKGGPLVSNIKQPFNVAGQNRGGMMMAQGGMMEQQSGQDQMMQMVQQVGQMLMQGVQPEQVMQQLVQSGMPQEQAMQVVQVAMQEVQGQQQSMQGQEQMMPQQGMARGGRMYANGGPPYDLPGMVDMNLSEYNSINTYLNNLNTPNYVDNQGNTSSILSRMTNKQLSNNQPLNNQTSPDGPTRRIIGIDEYGNPIYQNVSRKPVQPVQPDINYGDDYFLNRQPSIPMENYDPNVTKPANSVIGKINSQPGISYTQSEKTIDDFYQEPVLPQVSQKISEPIDFTPPTGTFEGVDILNNPVSINPALKNTYDEGWRPEGPSNIKTNQPNKGLGILDYGSMIGQAAAGFHQLGVGLKGGDPVNYDRIAVDKIDPTVAIALAAEESRRAQDSAAYLMRQSAPTSGSYMNNLRNLSLQSGKQRGALAGGLRYQADLTNTQMQNQVNAQNAQISMQEQIDRLQEKDAARTNVTEGLSGIGSSTANMIRDYRTNQINQTIANNIGTNDWRFDATTNEIIFRRDGKEVRLPAETVTGTNAVNIGTGEMQQSLELTLLIQTGKFNKRLNESTYKQIYGA
jgi:hypothetical protein